MSYRNGYTKTQARIVDLLSDGVPHSREELHACLDDDLARLTAAKRHLVEIRKHLRPQGQDIICVLQNRRIMYQWVRLLASANTGYV